jgi:glycosyltransferase involved in cell wall biosynthesis
LPAAAAGRRSLLKAWLHRRLWQRLPQRWRRRVLLELAGALAPLPDARPAFAAEPLYIAGALGTASGLGQGARLSLEALRASGRDARGIDLSDALMQDGRIPGYRVPPSGNGEGPGTIILHVSGFVMALALLRLGRRRVRGKTIIGYWAWELPDLPPEWIAGLRFVHEIWVPSRFTAAAVERHTSLPIRVVPHPVPPASGWSQRTEAPLTVLVAFDMRSGFVRKNPLAAIAAFRLAFGADPAARLIVKVAQPLAYPAGWGALEGAVAGAANIVLDGRLLDAAGMAALLDAADIVLSLHRAEGFGLVLAEAMQRGKPVVATAWSGNTEFLTAENSRPVAFRLVPARDPQGSYDYPEQCWAEPEIADAARHLQALRDPAERLALGARARTDAAARFARERHHDTVAEILCLPPLCRLPASEQRP